jgi:hypothetical protein
MKLKTKMGKGAALRGWCLSLAWLKLCAFKSYKEITDAIKRSQEIKD